MLTFILFYFICYVIIVCVLERSVSQDEEKSDTWSKGLLKILKGKDYQKKSMRETAPKVNVTEDENSL